MILGRNAAIALVLAFLASTQVAVPTGSARSRVPPSARARAERNVLLSLNRGWGRRWLLRQPGGRRWLPRIVNPRTGLLQNNTRAFCRRGHRRNRLACVVRPANHRRLEGLYVSYRNLGRGRFRITPLFFRRGPRSS